MDEPPYYGPYEDLVQSPAWSVVDTAIIELVENQDLVETTHHSLVVGFLVRRLTDARVLADAAPDTS